MMRFRGGGVGHSSTRAGSDSFKNDRDDLDTAFQRARKESQTHSNADEDDKNDRDDLDSNITFQQTRKELWTADEEKGDSDDNEMSLNTDILDGERDILGDVDEEGQLSDSEVVDYGYELESDLDEEDGGRETDEEDDITETLEYADY